MSEHSKLLVPVQTRSLDEFEALIKQDLLMVKEGLVRAGQHLLAARDEHPRSFVRWLDSGVAGMSRSSAYRLMEIARSDLPKLPTLENFPSESGALLELAKLSASQLREALDAGDISSEMHRKDAKNLVARYRKQWSTAERDPDGDERKLSEVAGQTGQRSGSVEGYPVAAGAQCPLRLTFLEAKVLLRCLLYVKAATTHQRVFGYEEEYAALTSVKLRLESLLGFSTTISAPPRDIAS